VVSGIKVPCFTHISWYGANRLKRVPVVLQNVMLYVIRAKLFNKSKMISGGQLFKSQIMFTYYAIVFTSNISMEVILHLFNNFSILIARRVYYSLYIIGLKYIIA